MFSFARRLLNGSNIVLLESQDEEISNNKSAIRKISNQRVLRGNTWSEVQFLWNLNAADAGLKLNKCTSDANGASVVMLSGKLDDNGQILFETSSEARHIGPFCFDTSSCLPMSAPATTISAAKTSAQLGSSLQTTTIKMLSKDARNEADASVSMSTNPSSPTATATTTTLASTTTSPQTITTTTAAATINATSNPSSPIAVSSTTTATGGTPLTSPTTTNATTLTTTTTTTQARTIVGETSLNTPLITKYLTRGLVTCSSHNCGIH